MNDKELADRVVALGVGRQGKHPKSCDGVGFYFTPKDSSGSDEGMYSSLFVRDWRVAGPMMEKCIKDDRLDLRCVSGSWMPSLERFDACVATSATPTYGVYLDRSNESLPRAIIEACCEALYD